MTHQDKHHLIAVSDDEIVACAIDAFSRGDSELAAECAEALDGDDCARFAITHHISLARNRWADQVTRG